MLGSAHVDILSAGLREVGFTPSPDATDSHPVVWFSGQIRLEVGSPHASAVRLSQNWGAVSRTVCGWRATFDDRTPADVIVAACAAAATGQSDGSRADD